MEPETWEERYRKVPRMSSGDPNSTLVTETASLAPGRALDIGCGEGSDAIWLAENEWAVTAIDIAPTALQRAATSGSPHADRIAWRECDLTKDPLPAGPYDLVTMHYLPLLSRDADRIVPEVLNTVAPGGTFLFVTHDLDDLNDFGDFDPGRYCQPPDIARRLGAEWTITTEEKRPRTHTSHRETPHQTDAILRCSRNARTAS